MKFKTPEKLKILENNYIFLKDECILLPPEFIQDEQRGKGEWCDTNKPLELVKKLENGYGWVKSWHDDGSTWISWPIIYDGIPLHNNCKHCPKTFSFLSNIEGIRVAAFNKMLPKTTLGIHVDPETGLSSKRIAYNLGLDVPDECHLYMKNNKIKVKNGESVTFDSTFPHFADNKSEHDRTILYLDVSLTDDEVKLL